MQNIAHNMLKQVSCKVKLFYENFLKLFENSEHSAVGTARYPQASPPPATQKTRCRFPGNGFR